MTAKEKIAEAEYFLSHLPTSPVGYLTFELSAFLSATRSIFHHLLEDYRQKFKLGEIEWLTARTFKETAKRESNKPALRFVTWYHKELTKIRHDHEFLFVSRDMSIHFRNPKKTFRTDIKLATPIPTGMTVGIPITSFPMGVSRVERPLRKSSSGEIARTIRVEVRTMAFFKEMPNAELIGLCTGFLNSAKRFVGQAELVWGKFDSPHKLTTRKSSTSTHLS